MEIIEKVTLAEVEGQLRRTTSKRSSVSVIVNGIKVSDLRRIGERYWFEYHCFESHDSSDAQVWYHSHQQCEVLGFADCDNPAFTTFKERAEAGHQLLYRVRFDDGLEWGVFEDELLDSPKEFISPDPPKEKP